MIAARHAAPMKTGRLLSPSEQRARYHFSNWGGPKHVPPQDYPSTLTNQASVPKDNIIRKHDADEVMAPGRVLCQT